MTGMRMVFFTSNTFFANVDSVSPGGRSRKRPAVDFPYPTVPAL